MHKIHVSSCLANSNNGNEGNYKILLPANKPLVSDSFLKSEDLFYLRVKSNIQEHVDNTNWTWWLKNEKYTALSGIELGINLEVMDCICSEHSIWIAQRSSKQSFL